MGQPSAASRHRKSAARSNRHINLANLPASKLVIDYSHIFADRVLDILQRLGFGSTLLPATRQAGYRDGNTIFGWVNGDAVAHGASWKVPNISRGYPQLRHWALISNEVSLSLAREKGEKALWEPFSSWY